MAVEQESSGAATCTGPGRGSRRVDKKAPSTNGGVDPVVLCAVGGVLALVALLVWALLSR